MGIIRVIKQSELQEGSSDEPIYPVTSIEAIYDLNNTKLSTVVNNITSNVQELDTNVFRAIKNINIVQGSIQTQEEAFNEFQTGFESFKEDVNNQIDNIKLPSISFKGILSGTTTDATRGTTSSNNHNVECSNSFNTSDPKCETLDLDNVTPGEAFFITKAGDYKIKDKVFQVSNLSILQCVQGDGEYTFNLYDLGIPFIPIPENKDIGKSLKVAENLTLYWG